MNGTVGYLIIKFILMPREKSRKRLFSNLSPFPQEYGDLTPLSPSPYLRRGGKFGKEGLTPLLDTPHIINQQGEIKGALPLPKTSSPLSS